MQYSSASFILQDYCKDADDTVNYITLTAEYTLNGTVHNIPRSGVISIKDYIVLINPQGPSDAGEYIVTLGVSDGLASVSQTFTVSIPNSAPNFTCAYPDITLPINTNLSFDFPPTVIDDDGNPITYTMSIENQGQPVALPTTCMRSSGGPYTLEVTPVLFKDLGKY